MKTLSLLLLLSSSLYASEVYFQGPCQEEPFLKGEVTGSGITAGAATIVLLNRSQIEYVGSDAGINSIAETPVGRGAIEVVSDTHLRAYGWCYEVDGFQPAAMPDQIVLKGDEVIRWFFAYSSYRDGQWMDYCTPSYQIRPSFLCKD